MEIPSDAELNAIVHRVVTQTLTGQGEVPARGTPASTVSFATPSRGQIVALGADHGGYALKETLKKHLEEKGYAIIDCGTHSTDSVDYPDYAGMVAKLVSEKRAWCGIMIDGAGIGSCMTANKIPGVRASMCYDHATANNAREHNDANVLTLGAGLIGVNLAKEITDIWLTTPFAGGRHTKRVEKIMGLDQKNSFHS